MDRRTFLVSTGAAAAAGAGSATAADPQAARAAELEIRRPLTVSFSPLFTAAYHRDLVDRFVSALAVATGGRFGMGAVAAPASASASPAPAGELWFGFADELCATEPAMGYFGGLPADLGMSSQLHRAWLLAAGGQMLWDRAAGEIGYKPFMIGHTSGLDGAWSRVELDFPNDVKGAQAALTGLPADIWKALGGTIATMRDVLGVPADLSADRTAYTEPRLSFTAAYAAGYAGSGAVWMRDGMKPTGSVMAVMVRQDVWSEMSGAEQDVFSAIAAQADLRHDAELRAHRALVAPHLDASSGVRSSNFGETFAAAVGKLSRDVVENLTAQNPSAARVHEAYMAFRKEATGLSDPSRKAMA